MRLSDLLKYCYHFDSNVQKIKIIPVTVEVKKYLMNNEDGVVINAFTCPIQRIHEDTKLCEFEVSEFGIENGNTLFVKLC